MRQTAVQFVIALFFVGVCQIAAVAQLDEWGRWKTDLYWEPAQLRYQSYSESDFANAAAKLAAIKLENNDSSNEWAGDYRVASGEVNHIALRWSPRNGFVYLNFYTCLPEVRYLNFGAVTATPDYISFDSHKQQRVEPKLKYLPVKWGERHYLVHQSEVTRFYKFVAGRGWKKDEYDFFNFLLRVGDDDKPILGMPVFPPGYERFVRKPIEAIVTKVLHREIKTETAHNSSLERESHTFIELNVGSANGAKPGLTLHVQDSEDRETAEVVRVGKRSSTAVIVRSLDENQQETFRNYRTDEIKSYPPVSIGWQLSTRSLLLISNGAG